MAQVRDSIFPQPQLLLDGLMRKKLSWPGKWTIGHKHGLFGGFCCCCFFFSCTSWPAKKYCQHLWTLLFLWPVAVTLLWPSLCQVYRWHRPLVDLWCTMVDQAVPNNMDLTAWTLEASVRRKITASPCSISGCAHKEAFCPGRRRLFLLLSFSVLRLNARAFV